MTNGQLADSDPKNNGWYGRVYNPDPNVPRGCTSWCMRSA